MEAVAYLRITQADICLRDVLRLVRRMWRGVVRSECKMKPRQKGAGLIVWCRDRKQQVLEAQVRYLIGEDGFILYIWQCPDCGKLVRAYEYPHKSFKNAYFGCMCPNTFVGYSHERRCCQL